MKTSAYLLVCFFFIFNLSFSQSFFDTSLPTITPTSPEAANMGRYGDVVINQATGKMSYSIPIHTIQVGGNSWPVSLEYNYGGFILEGKPSLSGLGWAFSGNGAVTREVRGLADGHDNGYYGQQNIKAIIDQYFADEANLPGSGFLNMSLFDLREGFVKGTYDSQVDKYTVNVGGLHFSFKIGGTKQAPIIVYLSKHNYKVELSWDTTKYYAIDSFIVTDDTGIQYYFSEKEKYLVDPDINIGSGTIDDNDTTTSWNLSKIKYLNGQEITFNYTIDPFVSYDLSAVGISLNADVAEGLPDSGVLALESRYADGITKSVLQRKILTNITFPSGTIDLNMSTLSYRKIYNTIIVKNNLGTTVNEFGLTYLGNRDALVKVTKNNQTLFDFEYFGISETDSFLPDFYTDFTRKPLDQDNWKYYNGAGNSYVLSLPVSSFIAYKEPDFNSTRLGALKKITYPTGGCTEVKYEQNSVKNVYTSSSVNNNTVAFNKQILVKLNATATNGEREAKLTYTFDEPVVATISHILVGRLFGNEPTLTIKRLDPVTGNQIVCPDLYSSLEPLTGDYHNHIDHLRLLLGEPIPPLCPRLTIALGPDGDAPGSTVPVPNVSLHGSTNGRVVIDAGTYEFRVALDDFDGIVEQSIYGEIKVQFYKPEGAANGGTLYVNECVGGIRVSQLKDYSESTTLSKIRYFNYSGDDGLSSAFLNQIPLKKATNSWDIIIPQGEDYSFTIDKYRLNAYTGANAAHGNPLYYTKITSYNSIQTVVPSDDPESEGGPTLIDNPDNAATVTDIGTQTSTNGSFFFPQGYTVTEYQAPANDNSFSYASLPQQEDLSSARLKGTSAYGFIEDQPYSLKSSTATNYSMLRGLLVQNNGGDDPDQDANPDHPNSFKAIKRQYLVINDPGTYDEYPSTQVGKDKVKSLYQIFEYKELNSRHRANKQTSVIDGMSQVTNYLYDTNDRLKETRTTDSENNTLKTINYYADEISNNDDYELIVSANRVNEVVKRESYFNDEKTGTQQTFYTDRWTVNALPEFVSTAKGVITTTNLLKERIKYHKYDDKGNPLEVSQVNGSSISYVWGYDQTYPVAKIENATYSQIESLDGFGTDFNLNSYGLTIPQKNSLRNSLPNALVTTYTYDPLIGVTSITDPRGYTIYYEYDELNRLKQVKDAAGNILSKNEYHYKDQ